MSKKTWQRVLGFVLAAIMVIGLVGCGTPANKETTKEPESKASEQQTQESDPTDALTDVVEEITYPLDTDVELTWWGQSDIKYQSAFNSAEESPFHIGLSKNTGVKINWEFPQDGVSTSQAFSLLLTEKVEDMPHLIHNSIKADQAEEMINDGIIWDLTEYLPKYAPDYWEHLHSDPINKVSAMTASGKYYWFCGGAEDSFNITYIGLAVRKDWLAECDLEVPTTIAEFENMLVKFKEKYGAVYTSPKLGLGMASGTGAFAEESAKWYVDNNEVKFANDKDEYKALLQVMNRWYEQGLMDPDLFTNDNATVRSMCLNNETGAMLIGSGTFRNILTDAEETGAEWIGIPHLVTEEGKEVTYFQTRKSNMGSKGTVITKACSEEELIVALKLLNYAYTDEGHMYWNFGDEGVTYTLDSEGNPQWTELITNAEVGANTAYKYYQSSGPNIQCEKLIRLLNEGTSSEAIEAWITNTDLARECYMPVVAMTEDEGAEYRDAYNAINTYMKECMQKFILGEMSFDEWDDYVSKMESMGLENCRKIQQAAYDRWYAQASGE